MSAAAAEKASLVSLQRQNTEQQTPEDWQLYNKLISVKIQAAAQRVSGLLLVVRLGPNATHLRKIPQELMPARRSSTGKRAAVELQTCR